MPSLAPLASEGSHGTGPGQCQTSRRRSMPGTQWLPGTPATATDCGPTFGGRTSIKEVNKQILNIQNNKSSYSVEWISHKVKMADIPSRELKCLPPSSATARPFRSRSSVCESSSVHILAQGLPDWYAVSEGMDKTDVTEAESNMNHLLSHYQQYQDPGHHRQGGGRV